MAPKKKAKAKAHTKAKASPKQTGPTGNTKQVGQSEVTVKTHQTEPKLAPEPSNAHAVASEEKNHKTPEKEQGLRESAAQAAVEPSAQAESTCCDSSAEKNAEPSSADQSNAQQLPEQPQTLPEKTSVEESVESGKTTDAQQSIATDSSRIDEHAPIPAEQITPPTKIVAELSKEERALRGLLQFVVCADAKRQSGGAAALLQLKYKDLILAYHNAVKLAVDPRADEPIIVESAAATDSQGGSVVASHSKVMSKEHLRAQLIAKQQTLEKELQGLRKKADLASQPITMLEEIDDATISEVHDAKDDSDLVQVTPQLHSSSAIDSGGSKRSSASNPPPPNTTGSGIKRPADFPSSREEREAMLRRKWQEVLDAQVDEERLKAKKRALEELRSGLKKELAVVKEERVKAMKLVAARQKEEADALERLRQALAICDEHKLQFPVDNTESIS